SFCRSNKHLSYLGHTLRRLELYQTIFPQIGSMQTFGYRIKPVEEVKYMKNGGEDDQKIAVRNQENLEKSASSNIRLKSNKEVPGLVHQPRDSKIDFVRPWPTSSVDFR
uniref:Uncharacterized protein n=1 Tax=Chelonoidis abingdonii TaxID=106734 RepID=A0A8C0GP64_CHEAB